MDLSNLQTNIETITLNEQTNYRLIEINKIKDYFECEIKEQEVIIRKLSKYITCFDYMDKLSTAFLTIFSGVNIFSHIKDKKYTGIISSVVSLFFCLSVGIIKKLLYETKKRKKKHNKILYLGKSDCVEMLLSQSITDLNISHEEFKAILDEKEDYDDQRNKANENKLSA